MKITHRNLLAAGAVLFLALALSWFISGVSGETTRKASRDSQPASPEAPGPDSALETAVFAVG